MTTSNSNLITAQQLESMRDDGNRCELVNGVLVMMSPAGSEHGRIAGRIFLRLATHVEENNLGTTYAAETGFRISESPDTVRAPHAAFVSTERMNNVPTTRGYLPLAPDLVVEVVSPSDSPADVEAKAQEWIQAGSTGVLVADPASQTINVYEPDTACQKYTSGEVYDASNACKAWQVAVDDVFAS